MAKQRRDKGDGGLFKDGRGYWTATVELPRDLRTGKRQRRTVKSKNYNTAQMKLKELRKKADEHSLMLTSAPKVSEWCAKWLLMPAVTNRKPKTKADYESKINRYVVPFLGKYKMDAVEPMMLLDMYAWMQKPKPKGGLGLSPTTAQGAHRVARKCFEDAMNLGVIPFNPVSRVDPPESAATEKPTITAGEALRFLQTYQTHPYVARYLVGLATGARQGEVLGLQAEYLTFYYNEDGEPIDIDFEFAWALQRVKWLHGCEATGDGKPCGKAQARWCPEKAPDIPANHESIHAYKGLWLLRPKTRKSWRVTAGGPFVAQVMHRYLNGRTEGLVFRWDNGFPVDPSDDWLRWNQWLEGAGLPRMPIHSQRHTANVLMDYFGMGEKERMDQLGHSSKQINRRYNRRQRALLAGPMEKINQALEFDFQPDQKLLDKATG